MTDIQKLISEAEKTRDDKKREYENAEYFYSTLVKSLGAPKETTSKTDDFESFVPPARKFVDKDQVDIASLGVTTAPAESFTTHVKAVVNKFGDQEFMVVHVEKLLEDMGQRPTGKSPRAKIAGTLTKLEKRGLVTKTHKGIGNEPNRYKLSEFVDENDTDKEKPKTNVLGLSK